MPTNGLAEFSNATFVATIVLYAVAMFGYAIEYAFSRRATKAAEAEVEQRELVAVGAPESAVAAKDDGAARDNNAGITPAQALTAGRVAFVAMIAAAVVHAGTLALRAAAVGRFPWGNMFEFIVALCLVCVVVWTVVVARGLAARRLGLFPMLAVVLLLGCATRVYTQATPLVPALDSYWIAIHVLAAILATGLFLTGFVTAVLHLIRRNYHRITERGGAIRFPFTIAPRLPEASRLENLTWRLHVLAFPIWTFAVIAGAIWAREAWSRYWGWDPKEVWAFIAWVVYAAYLHARATGAGGRRFAPWIAILGWGVILFNLFGVNLLVHSLHSYAGV